jgi:hypothetical protein
MAKSHPIKPDDTFDRWTVLSRAEPSNNCVRWLCRCVCGTERPVRESHLRSRASRSCGCVHRGEPRISRTQHGGYRSPEYRAWAHMIERCNNPDVPGYENYGGRGVRVCERWRNSFEDFLSDIGRRPSPRHSIDRFPNNDGNYEPDNCRWATPSEQMRNTRRTRLLTHAGETMCLTDWANRLGISYITILSRLRRGWPVTRALTVPMRKSR